MFKFYCKSFLSLRVISFWKWWPFIKQHDVWLILMTYDFFWNPYNFLTKKDISMEQILMDYIKIEIFGNNLGG